MTYKGSSIVVSDPALQATTRAAAIDVAGPATVAALQAALLQ